MKYASLIAGEGERVLPWTSFTFLNEVSMPQRFLYSFGIVLTSFFAFPSTFVAKGMSFPLFSLQQTTMVKGATFFESLSWIENGRAPCFPSESTAFWILALQTHGVMKST